MKIAYWIFMTFSIFILSLILFLKQNTQTIFGSEAGFYTASVYLEKSMPEDQATAIKKTIESTGNNGDILSSKVISADDQLTEFLEAMPNYTKDLVDGAEVKSILNPLIEVQLSPQAPHAIIIEKIKSISGVQQVSFASEWIEKIKNVFMSLDMILKSVFALFFIIISFLISLMIKNYLLAEKESISVYCLHGATPHQTLYRQFLPLAIYTLLSFVGGLVALFIVYQVMVQKSRSFEAFAFLSDRLQFLQWPAVALILAGVLLNLGLSYLLSYRHIVRAYYKYE